ncbi:MAG: hypothetical protein BVN33_00610 [Proteobacteria bacterium ST_bin13]|nr:MAG: hypothetical protein BVN33_00610 [Proteobacteria bacterium ST_bin13]
MKAVRTDPAFRAYLRRFFPTMALYVILVWASPFAIESTGATGPLLWAIAILPALPLMAVFWIIGRLLIELRDEYIRMLQIRQALVATGFAMSAASAWGFLEVYAHAPHLPLFTVPILWFGGLLIGSIVNVVLERQASDA